MLELIAAAVSAPVPYAPATAKALDGRVEAGLDFAQLLNEAHKEQAPLPKNGHGADESSNQEEAAAEAAATKDDERHENLKARDEDKTVEQETPTAKEQAEAVVAVVMEAVVKPEQGREAEGETDEDGEGETILVAPIRLSEAEEGEEAPLEADIESEGDEESAVLPPAAAVETDSGSPLELLNFSELIDPDLMVEKAPDQLIARITKAANSAASPMLEELAETVMPQVIRNMATLVREGGAEMRLQLKPADLGEIELRVRTTEGVVRGEMLVQNPEVKQLLDAQADRLKNALAAQGLALEGFDVNVNRDPRSGQTPEQGDRSENRRNAGTVDGVGGREDANAVLEAPVAVSIDNHEVDFTT